MFIKENLLYHFNYYYENVIFGYFNFDRLNNEAFVITMLVLFVKLHIHKCVFSNKKNLFYSGL